MDVHETRMLRATLLRGPTAGSAKNYHSYLLIPPRPQELATRLRRLLERYDLDSRIELRN